MKRVRKMIKDSKKEMNPDEEGTFDIKVEEQPTKKRKSSKKIERKL